MSPERALEIWDANVAKVGIARAILAAAAESAAAARREALTEAAQICRDTPMPKSPGSFDYACVTCARAIERLRDQESK